MCCLLLVSSAGNGVSRQGVGGSDGLSAVCSAYEATTSCPVQIRITGDLQTLLSLSCVKGIALQLPLLLKTLTAMSAAVMAGESALVVVRVGRELLEHVTRVQRLHGNQKKVGVV